MTVTAFTIFAVIVAYLVKGMCGFANTLVFTAILSFKNDNIGITPVDLLIGIPSNILMAVRERQFIRLRTWLPLSLMVFAGSVPGILLLWFGSARTLKLILGCAIVGIGIEMLLREQKPKKRSSHLVLTLIGIVSGALCGMFGIGALLAAYMGRVTDTTDEFRGNLSMVLLTDNIFRFFVYLATGILTGQVIRKAAILFPFMLLGLGGGMLLARITDEHIMKQMIIVLLVISGVALFLSNL